MAIAPTGPIDADGHIRDDDRRMREFLAPPFDKRSPLGIGANDGFDRHYGSTLGLFDVDAPTSSFPLLASAMATSERLASPSPAAMPTTIGCTASS